MNEARQEGHCRCGAVRFAAEGAPLITMACHCRGCQRMAASAFSLSSLYPAEAFSLSEGETVLGGLKQGTRHHFCPSCMTWLFTRPEGMEAFVNVRSSMFDDPAQHLPFMETYVSEALPGFATGAVRAFETVPADEDFPSLLSGYAAWRESEQAQQEGGR